MRSLGLVTAAKEAGSGIELEIWYMEEENVFELFILNITLEYLKNAEFNTWYASLAKNKFKFHSKYGCHNQHLHVCPQ